MTAATLIGRLHAAGVQLTANGDKLHISAPAGVLTPELRAELVEHKAALMAALTGPRVAITDGCARTYYLPGKQPPPPPRLERREPRV